MSRGRPGMCTSPAEIIVVTPPLSELSIQWSWLWRGVQSPATGWTWLSMRPGERIVPLASTTVPAPAVSTSFSLPTAAMRPFSATTVSASRTGDSRSPLNISPMLRTTSLSVFGASAMARLLVVLPPNVSPCSSLRPRFSAGRPPPKSLPCEGRRRAVVGSAAVTSPGRTARRPGHGAMRAAAATAATAPRRRGRGARPRR